MAAPTICAGITNALRKYNFGQITCCHAASGRRAITIASILFFTLTPLYAYSDEVISEKPKIGGFAAEPMGAGSIAEVLIGLVVVLIVFAAMMWFMRKVGGVGKQAGGAMKVLGAMSVGTRERVVLVKVGDEQILLGVAPGRVQALHKLEKPIADDSSNDEAASFSDRLKTALNRGKQS